jgi:hypothetical protein
VVSQRLKSGASPAGEDYTFHRAAFVFLGIHRSTVIIQRLFSVDSQSGAVNIHSRPRTNWAFSGTLDKHNSILRNSQAEAVTERARSIVRKNSSNAKFSLTQRHLIA